MKRLGLFMAFAILMACAGPVFCQTAAQYLAAGNQTYVVKDYAKAVQYFQAAIQLDPKSAAAYQGLGNSYYQQGQKSEALEAYEKAIALDPDNAQLENFTKSLRAKGVNNASTTSEGSGSQAGPTKFELDVLTGLNLALSGSGGAAVPAAYSDGLSGGGYGAAVGLGAGVYFPAMEKIMIGGNVSYYGFGSTSSTPNLYGESITVKSSQSEIEFAVAGKYKMEGGNVTPYLLGGLGFALVNTSGSVTITGITTEGIDVPSASAFAPMIQLGGGIQMPAGQNMNFFAEGKFNILFVGGSNLSETILGTTYTVPEPGYTFIEFPINVGLNFNM